MHKTSMLTKLMVSRNYPVPCTCPHERGLTKPQVHYTCDSIKSDSQYPITKCWNPCESIHWHAVLHINWQNHRNDGTCWQLHQVWSKLSVFQKSHRSPNWSLQMFYHLWNVPVLLPCKHKILPGQSSKPSKNTKMPTKLKCIETNLIAKAKSTSQTEKTNKQSLNFNFEYSRKITCHHKSSRLFPTFWTPLQWSAQTFLSLNFRCSSPHQLCR